MRKYVIMGVQGSGKGTQSARLCEAFGLEHISVGDIFRWNIAHHTKLGAQVRRLVDAGHLVSDDIVASVVRDRLEQHDWNHGFVVDGFPRNVAQAQALNDAVVDAIGTVILLEADTDELVARLVKRADEEGRADDNEETIRRRLEIYQRETAPLVEHYGSAVTRIDGVGTIDEVFSRIALALAG